ncbi:MAG: serine hydrolase domain-containing protein [Acidobacteriota bacterium]
MNFLRRLSALSILVVVSFSTGLSQALPTVQPEQVGLSSRRLQRINEVFQDYVDKRRLAGLIAVVARHGEVAQFQTLGYSDLESRKPMRRDAIFRIYSMTKPIIGVGLMTLFEEGRFQLTDPVSKYIPELKGLKVAKGQLEGGIVLEEVDHEMTIRELMTHTSGLTYGLFSRSPVDTLYRKADVLSRDGTLEDMVEKLSRIPLWAQPGTKWHYSVAADVQGYLIQILSGQRLDEFLRLRIFQPLKMVDTGFYVPQGKLSRFTTNYGPPKAGQNEIRVIDRPSESRFARPPTFLSGGGGLVSTASDYLRFCQMLLNGGELDGNRILGLRTVELMTRNHLSRSIGEISPNSGVGFGLDFAVVLDPIRVGSLGSAGEFNWGGLASTVFWIDRKEDLIAILMTQFIPSGHYPLRAQFKNLIYQAILK